MASAQRAAALEELASLILGINQSSPTRVAIDGRTASGKTTLADELSKILSVKGRNVIRTSIDGFHRPKIERYARGRFSAEGYYYDARDLQAINTLLLSPLGPDGDRLYRTASFDLDKDEPIEQRPHLAANNAILLVDGTFLQRPELRDGWDLTIFVETSEQVSEQRGIHRDASHLGGLRPHGSSMQCGIGPLFISMMAYASHPPSPMQFSTTTTLISLRSSFEMDSYRTSGPGCFDD
jgi:uridine kinase